MIDKTPSGYDAHLRWTAAPGAVAYRVFWRPAWGPDWQHEQLVGNVTELVLPNILIKITGGTSPNFGKSATTNGAGQYTITGVVAERIVLEASNAAYEVRPRPSNGFCTAVTGLEHVAHRQPKMSRTALSRQL
jgi:hypothetical protein